MELTPEDVQEILRILEQSSFDELYLETPQLKLIVRRGAATPSAADTQQSASVPRIEPRTGETARAAEVTEAPPPPAISPPVEEQPVPQPATPSTDQFVPIAAPLKGIFYRAPRPGAPPFVEVGSHVEEDTVVAIIEVMKLMHSVQAGVRGTIVQVCVENGDAVERGQPLFLVRPDDSAVQPVS